MAHIIQSSQNKYRANFSRAYGPHSYPSVLQVHDETQNIYGGIVFTSHPAAPITTPNVSDRME